MRVSSLTRWKKIVGKRSRENDSRPFCVERRVRTIVVCVVLTSLKVIFRKKNFLEIGIILLEFTRNYIFVRIRR